MTVSNKNTLGIKIRWQRIAVSLTLPELAAKSGVSASHLGRIERGERFPSARVLQKIAPYKRIREVEFIDEIPKTPVGKVLRRVLRDRERANQP